VGRIDNYGDPSPNTPSDTHVTYKRTGPNVQAPVGDDCDLGPIFVSSAPDSLPSQNPQWADSCSHARIPASAPITLHAGRASSD